tara:strand:+ start:9562 stop:9882 length:321 start_codon:yes stop_codon:yes gene_type:complete
MATLSVQCKDEKHGCRKCQPDIVFTGSAERLGRHHVAVRFGDIHCQVYLDGVNVSKTCFEAVAGTPGIVNLNVLHEDGGQRGCRCGEGRCETKVEGKVEIVRSFSS